MKRKLKGSYTVEASLLFPFLLTILVLIIYFAFFIHDRCMIHRAIYTAALRGSQILDEQEDISAYVEENSRQLLDDRLLAVRDYTTEIQISDKEISVVCEAVLQIPVGARLIQAMGRDGIPIKVKSTAKRIDNVKFLRECRILENTWKNRSD